MHDYGNTYRERAAGQGADGFFSSVRRLPHIRLR
ncbi:hypothetical protein AFE_3006 [Acidithiobacillus ferrooxidans ATCC 23270]|uniref:Uncharacterized protein n=1 Tax=Acidithiobacillus ferrooxidans (strain ATCC 23270 / DSM 14882 / CIP 104768 / NCIMB 8455) TaxID=243159 RepID=B7J9X9_ACIF2|nr:hypothetical protein AFE_3006 [Acidithiobacillus ferrooxidans ATCC 23270]